MLFVLFLASTLLAVAVNGVKVSPFFGPQRIGNDKLLFVHALWRHGDRTSTQWLDPWSSIMAGNKGDLTEAGALQHRQLGAILRARYVDKFHLLPSQMDKSTFTLQSSAINRTRLSALNNIRGMYRPYTYKYTDPGVYVRSPIDLINMPWSNCPRNRKLVDLVHNTPEVRAFFQKYQGLFQRWGYRVKQTINRLGMVNAWYDPIETARRHSLRMGAFASDYSLMQQAVRESYRFRYGLGVKPYNNVNFAVQMRRGITGSLMNDILVRMENVLYCRGYSTKAPANAAQVCSTLKTKRYHAYSTHDTALMAFSVGMGTGRLNFNTNLTPELASLILVELWVRPDNRHYIKVLNRRNQEEIYDFTANCAALKPAPTVGNMRAALKNYLVTNPSKFCSI